MYIKDINFENDKIHNRLYILQEVKAYQFLKLNEERPN